MAGVSGIVQAWELAFGFAPSLVAKAACELGIPDMLAEQPLSARDIAEKLSGTGVAGAASPSSSCGALTQQQMQARVELMERMMRFLSTRGVFEAQLATTGGSATVLYAQTPLSACLVQSGNPTSLRSMLLFQNSKEMMAPWHHLSEAILQAGGNVAPFNRAHGSDVWALVNENETFRHFLNAAMSSASYISVHAFLAHYRGLEHVHTLVDVGGGTGTVASYITARYPSIKVINFDLPHVVASAPRYPGVEHVGGDMFEAIPSGDSIFMKWILHDWSDEDCIKILKNCHKALPSYGKVIIMDAVLENVNTPKGFFNDLRVTFDMVMAAHTSNGKERTREQWERILQAANFSNLRFYDIPSPQCVIEAWPCCST